MSRFALVLTVLAALMLVACTPQPPREVPPASQPANPLERPAPPPLTGSPVAPDRSCRTDSDCTVKNVGNCCGYYPACVNVNARTDPGAVAEQCRKTGMAGVCGFPDISACSCVQGQCRADNRVSAK